MYIDSHITVGATLGVLLFKEVFMINTSDNFVATLLSFVLGAVIGFLPDFDFLNKKLKSNIYYLEHHRKWTHSILVHIPLSIILSFILLRFKVIEWGNFWFCSLGFFIILFSHLVLDLFTSWGIYLFYPFKKVVSTSSVSIFDLFFSSTMSIQVIFIFSVKNIYVVYIPIIVAFLYLILGYCLSFYIKKVFLKALVNQDISYYEMDVKPTFGNTLLWTINVRVSDDSYLIGYYSILQKTKEITFVSFTKNEDLVDYNDAELLAIIARLKRVFNNWYSYTIKDSRLYVNDVRYGFKTTDLNETEFAQPFLVEKYKSGYDVFRKTKFKKGVVVKLIIRIFKV